MLYEYFVNLKNKTFYSSKTSKNAGTSNKNKSPGEHLSKQEFLEEFEIMYANETRETRILTIEDGQIQDAVIHILEKDWILEFRLGPSLFGHRVTIFTNVPSDGNAFSRSVYQPLHWINPTSSDDSLIARLEVNRAGPYQYYFKCSDKTRGSGYFIVNPRLGIDSYSLPLDSVQCITYISKNLGPFSRWEKILEVAKETGYNVIHFTPIQVIGGSQSAYSIMDQLTINPTFEDDKYPTVTWDDITSFMEKLRQKWKMFSICDIVLNHTANESAWIQEHPECTYNMINSPYLKPAYLLDILIYQFSNEVSKGYWELKGIPSVVDEEQHLGAMWHALTETVIPKGKFEEFYFAPVDSLVTEFLDKCRKLPPPKTDKNDPNSLSEFRVIQDPQYRRMKSTVDMNLALKLYNIYHNDCFDEESRLQKCAAQFKSRLESSNVELKNQLNTNLRTAIDNLVAQVRYSRVAPDGPRSKEISNVSPLFTRYFTDYKNEPLEEHMICENGAHIMAHNGWLLNDGDSMRNFAGPRSQTYLRRDLIAWGDSVKLRYGDSPEDCPHLWNFMREYVERTVKTFDGLRLDNCHSTPIHVAEYLLDAARAINPDVYIIAELFTTSERTDNVFVNRLGITSLIREGMSAWDSHELGRLIYRYGGEPIGAFIKPNSRPLRPTVAHALFFDVTHDNPSPLEKRTIFDMLPSSALISMACCGSGSTMGYDELVPEHISVVGENRTYMEWSPDRVNENSGIVAGKKTLNELHYYLGKNGFQQVFVDQVDPDIVCVTRHNDVTHESVILISYTAFHNPNPHASGEGKGITVTGCVENIIVEAYIEHDGGDRYENYSRFVNDAKIINGLTEYKLNMRRNFSPNDVSTVRLTKVSANSTRVDLTWNFKPGCIIAIKFRQAEEIEEALKKVNSLPDLAEVKKSLTLADLNKVLFCCDAEDGGAYTVPNFGSFVYCGLQGILSAMDAIALNNDLGHPICDNIRQGDWLMDYTINRLKNKPGTKLLGARLEEIFEPLKKIARHSIPRHFYNTVSLVYQEMIEHAWSSMSDSVKNGSRFYKLLASGSLQMGGVVESSPLPMLSPNISEPAPVVDREKMMPLCVSCSAGLPFFAAGYMRNWGRDTFIALRGLFILTGRFDEARYLILSFGGCLRHGLIPNLLDGGKKARYNSRDAIWWWLYSIKCYVCEAPNGENILKDKVNRLYPTDDSSTTSEDQSLDFVIQEAMDRHFQGVCFRERNAGQTIDEHMISQGFNVQIGVNPATGFVFGGNEWNCGTWMDKMGSSDKAKTRGKPATPRDGSAIELVALCKAGVMWLAEMHDKGVYPYVGVNRRGKNGSEIYWTYSQWSDKIQANFEKHFWIPTTTTRDDVEASFVHRRGIYKDSVEASLPWANYQLRCNYFIAMVVAPELFDPKNAWSALETGKSLLLGPLGMKTLDPDDWAYDGFYDNSNDSTDSKIAHGFNYHQGPEWLWPVGFYLRARLYFSSKFNDDGSLVEREIFSSKSYLANHYSHLQSSDWKGLPELTNKDGAYCQYSCRTQAWSIGTILEAVHDIEKTEKKIRA